MSFMKILFLVSLIVLSSAWTEEKHVLILTAEDFPGVLTEFPHILVEFYAPWCGHCKKLAPIYDEVAKELNESGSTVRVAKIDADTHSSVKGDYGIKGFPTLLFFSNGQEIKYNGQRTKEFMVNWLSKKTGPAVVAINPSQLGELESNGKVSIIYHGDISEEHGKLLQEIGAADDYNDYYSVKGSELPAGTVQILRPFGQSETTVASSDLKQWINKYERPTVYPFNDRTIGDIFAEKGVGVILFHPKEGGEALDQAFKAVANEFRIERGKSIIFAEVKNADEHYNGLSGFLKILTDKSPIVVVDGGKRVKLVLEGNAADITTEQIIAFVEGVENGTGKEYKVDEEITYKDGGKVEDQL